MPELLYLSDGNPFLCCNTQALEHAVIQVAQVADDKLWHTKNLTGAAQSYTEEQLVF